METGGWRQEQNLRLSQAPAGIPDYLIASLGGTPNSSAYSGDEGGVGLFDVQSNSSGGFGFVDMDQLQIGAVGSVSSNVIDINNFQL